jgi:hypothetical protein
MRIFPYFVFVKLAIEGGLGGYILRFSMELFCHQDTKAPKKKLYLRDLMVSFQVLPDSRHKEITVKPVFRKRLACRGHFR